MAKGSLFVGSGSGKVGNLVLANTKQGQVTRAYQPNVTNPKSRAQMLQRAKFACAVKFFKQATQNFFKFAFEDRTKVESDYNAFMRHNIKNAIPMSRELYENVSVPALGNVFQMSSGRLQNPLQLSFVANTAAGDNKPDEMPQVTLPAAAADATIGGVSKVLIDAGLQAGDIITLVLISSAVEVSDLEDLTAFDDTPEPPMWTIAQFVIDETSTVALTDVPAIGSFATDGKVSLTMNEGKTAFTGVATKGAALFASIVVTRKLSDGLYASNSFLQGDTKGKALIAELVKSETVANALLSWGSKGTAILKGSVASK